MVVVRTVVVGGGRARGQSLAKAGNLGGRCCVHRRRYGGQREWRVQGGKGVQVGQLVFWKLGWRGMGGEQHGGCRDGRGWARCGGLTW